MVNFPVSYLLLVLYMKLFMRIREVDIVVMDLRRVISGVMMVMGGGI